MSIKVSLEFSEEDLKYFREAMTKAVTSESTITEAQTIQQVQSICAGIGETKVPDFVKEKIEKLDTLVQMLGDAEWQLPEEERNDIVNSLKYFCKAEDLVPDDLPLLGFLDDAIMIELVLRDLSENVDSYREFCQFRRTEENRRGADAGVTRESWLADKRRQLHSRMRERRSSRRGGRIFSRIF